MFDCFRTSHDNKRLRSGGDNDDDWGSHRSGSSSSFDVRNQYDNGCGGLVGGGRRSGHPDSSSDIPLEAIEQASIKLNEMSLQERSQVEYELHGISDNDLQERTPEMLAQIMDEMDEVITKLVSGSMIEHSSAYIKALARNKAYVDKLKLQCLQCKSFNTTKAATLLLLFFDRKLSLFGDNDSLCREILLEKDFTDEEHEAFQQGLIMLLPHCDRAGRAILVVNGSINEQYSTRSVMKVLHYVWQIALQDSNCSKNGMVVIYFGFGQTKTIPGRPKEFWLSWRSIPIKIVGCHYCGENTNEDVLTPAVQHLFALADRFTVCRFRMHFGPLVECMYKLLTFGLPMNDAMPVTPEGTIDLKYHHEMLETWKVRERQMDLNVLSSIVLEEAITDSSCSSFSSDPILISKPHCTTISKTGDFLDDQSLDALLKSMPLDPIPSQGNSDSRRMTDENRGRPVSSSSTSISSQPDGFVIPGPMDILMGRGRHPKSRPGSMRLHELVLEHRQEYDVATKHEKMQISQIILQSLKDQGCRFLNYTQERGYEICDDNVSRRKISHGFRNLRIKENSAASGKKKNKQSKQKRGLEED